MKISNENNLRQLALSELDKRVAKWAKGGFKDTSFRFSFEGTRVIPGFEKTTTRIYTITVRLANRPKEYLDGYVKRTSYDTRSVFINTNHLVYSPALKDRAQSYVKSILVHEITHVSQEFNGVADTTSDIHHDLFLKSGTRLNYQTWYNTKGHHLHPAEHECMLAQLSQYLLDDESDEVVRLFLLDRSNYFHFTPEQFAAMGAEYGVTPAQSERIKPLVQAYLDSRYGNPDAFDVNWMVNEYERMMPLFKMVAVDESYRTLLVTSMSAAVAKQVGRPLWGYISPQLQETATKLASQW